LGRSFETREERTHPIDKNACKPHHEIEMYLEDDERSTRIVNWVLNFFLGIVVFIAMMELTITTTMQGQQKCNLEML